MSYCPETGTWGFSKSNPIAGATRTLSELTQNARSTRIFDAIAAARPKTFSDCHPDDKYFPALFREITATQMRISSSTLNLLQKLDDRITLLEKIFELFIKAILGTHVEIDNSHVPNDGKYRIGNLQINTATVLKYRSDSHFRKVLEEYSEFLVDDLLTGDGSNYQFYKSHLQDLLNGFRNPVLLTDIRFELLTLKQLRSRLDYKYITLSDPLAQTFPSPFPQHFGKEITLAKYFRLRPAKDIYRKCGIWKIPAHGSFASHVSAISAINARASELKQRVQNGCDDLMRKGWFCFFVTLSFRTGYGRWKNIKRVRTLVNGQAGEDTFFADGKHTQNWNKYIQDLQNEIALDAWHQEYKGVPIDQRPQLDKLRYVQFCRVHEYGGERGRIHFHMLLFTRYLPLGCTDPNLGRNEHTYKEVKCFNKHWPYGFCIVEPVRYRDDPFSRLGWFAVCTKNDDGTLSAKQLGDSQSVAFYVTKYLGKDASTRLGDLGVYTARDDAMAAFKAKYKVGHIRFSSSKGFGLLAAKLSDLTTDQLVGLSHLPYTETCCAQHLRKVTRKELARRQLLQNWSVADYLSLKAQTRSFNYIGAMRQLTFCDRYEIASLKPVQLPDAEAADDSIVVIDDWIPDKPPPFKNADLLDLVDHRKIRLPIGAVSALRYPYNPEKDKYLIRPEIFTRMFPFKMTIFPEMDIPFYVHTVLRTLQNDYAITYVFDTYSKNYSAYARFTSMARRLLASLSYAIDYASKTIPPIDISTKQWLHTSGLRCKMRDRKSFANK